MAPWLGALAALLQDLGLVPSTELALQLSITPVVDDPILFPDLCGHQANTWYTYMFADKNHSHTKINKLKKCLKERKLKESSIMPAIPELVRWRQENQEFKVILNCVVSWMPAWAT